MPRNAVAAVELENPLGDVVEKIAVVGHRDDGARILLQIALEPGDRFRVEVVRRLIEQQHVGLREQQPAQRDAPLLAARELADHGFPGRQPQRIRRDLELALQLPATDRVDLVLQLRLLLEELVHLLIVHGLREAVADALNSLDQRLHVSPTPSPDGAAHILAGSSCGSCGR